MSTRLPKGNSDLHWSDQSLWGYPVETNDVAEYGTNENGDPAYVPTDLTKVCQCGVHKTYGDTIPGWYHSSWCQLYTKKEL